MILQKASSHFCQKTLILLDMYNLFRFSRSASATAWIWRFILLKLPLVAKATFSQISHHFHTFVLSFVFLGRFPEFSAAGSVWIYLTCRWSRGSHTWQCRMNLTQLARETTTTKCTEVRRILVKCKILIPWTKTRKHGFLSTICVACCCWRREPKIEHMVLLFFFRTMSLSVP